MDKAELRRKIRKFIYDTIINGNMDYEGITNKIMKWVKEVK